MGRRGWVSGMLLLVVLAGGGYTWWHAGIPPFGRSKQEAAAKPARLAVRVVEAQRKTVPTTLRYTGTVMSPLDAELRARVTGTIVERAFTPGQEVRAGAVLFRIDPRPFEAALLAARGQREAAQATLEFAGQQLERYRPLTRQGYASDERLDQASRDRSTAAGQLQVAEGQIRQQELNLEYAEVRAPFAGRTGLTDINVGDLVTADQTSLVTLAQLHPIEIQVAMSSSDLAEVRKAATEEQAPKVLLLDGQGKPDGREATVYKIDNRFNPRTARALVRALLSNEEEHLLPGDFVQVQVQTGSSEKVLLPTAAVMTRLNQRIVYVVRQDGTVHGQPITPGDEFGDQMAVDGLEAGTQVVVNNLQRLRDGQEVRPETQRQAQAVR